MLKKRFVHILRPVPKHKLMYHVPASKAADRYERINDEIEQLRLDRPHSATVPKHLLPVVTKRIGKKLVKVPLTKRMAEKAIEVRYDWIKKMGKLTRGELQSLEREKEQEAKVARMHKLDPKKFDSVEAWREKRRL